jgi:hypothetical protein
MFRIKHHRLNEDVKMHFASTRRVAEQVMLDLSSRFTGYFEIIEEPDIKCCWDPGGMLMADDESFSFPLGNITILCKAQHFDFFVNHMQAYEPRGTGSQYIKIHSHWTCICLEVKEFEQLLRLVCNPEYAVRAEHAWHKREDGLNKLADDGYIVRAVVGEDGKLYKAPKSKAVDKKLLN